jgi:tetratricopeptide (TPR) repeat protein
METSSCHSSRKNRSTMSCAPAAFCGTLHLSHFAAVTKMTRPNLTAALRPRKANPRVSERGERLEGWKQIAAYLKRDVRTVQRWERTEKFPVRRQMHRKLGNVLAFKDELDRWMDQRCSSHSKTTATTSSRAYELYLKGRQLFHQFRRKNFERARQMFARAIEEDHEFAAAYAGLADCCSYLYLYWEATRENLVEADSASRKAVELAPNLAEAHASRGVALSTLQNYPEAEKEFRAAIRLDRALYEAHYFYGRACMAQGKYKEAVEPFESAAGVRSEDFQALCFLGLAYSGLGYKAKAAAAYARSIEVAKQQLSVNPGDVRALYLGAICWARMGRRKEALAWAAKALALDSEDSAVLYNVACLYAVLHRTDEALNCLNKVVRSGWRKEWIRNDPDLASLRDNPEFQRLLR